MPQRERMTSVDTAWLRMDRRENLMMIVAVLTFEQPVALARLRRVVAERFLAHRRFRQRPVQEPAGSYWEDDPAFDLKRHVSAVKLGKQADEAALRTLAARLIAEPLDPAHPLWQFALIERYGRGSALVARIHHCYADGIALVGVMLALTDDAALPVAGTGALHDKAVKSKPPTDQDPRALDRQTLESLAPGPLAQFVEPVTDALRSLVKLSGGTIERYVGALRDPSQAIEFARTGAAIGREIAQLATMPDDSRTRFKGKPGVEKRVAWSELIPLDEVKAVGYALGASVNDVLLACVAGALGHYLRVRRESLDNVEIRALVPVNLRPPGKEAQLGNRFGLVALEMPLWMSNPIERVIEVRRRMEALKQSYQAVLTLGVLGLVGLCPKPVQQQILDILAAKATAVMTNVPGPQQALYLCGAKLDSLMFWVPQSGDIGMGVSILSYNGGVRFGLVTDAGLTPDPENVIARFPQELETLLLTVLMEPWGERRDPALIERELAGNAPVSRPSRPSRRRAVVH